MIKINWKKLLVRVSIPVIGGVASGYIANRVNKSHSTEEQYRKLKSPPGSPAPLVFPIVWTGLYTTMGIAYHLVKEERKHSNVESTSYYAQLGLNMLWSYLFFGLRLRGIALIECFILLSTILLTSYQFRKVSKTAGKLMLPYIMWTTFATYLNAGTWYLNRNLSKLEEE